MNKNIGSMVSWRTKFAVAAVAFASVFTAWGQEQQYTEVNDYLLNWSISPVWTGVSATGPVEDWDSAVLYLFNREILRDSIEATTVQNGIASGSDISVSKYFAPETSAQIDSYVITIFSGATEVASTAKTSWSTVIENINTRTFDQVGLKLIDHNYTIVASAVAPEPTSGLLLLLGVAGLALKRRRQVA